MTKKARVVVTIKKDVLDPAGSAIKNALVRQGLSEILEVRVGKVIDIVFKPHCDPQKHMNKLDEASRTFLSNPVVEDFAIKLDNE